MGWMLPRTRLRSASDSPGTRLVNHVPYVPICMLVARWTLGMEKCAVADHGLLQGLKMKCIASSVAGICER